MIGESAKFLSRRHLDSWSSVEQYATWGDLFGFGRHRGKSWGLEASLKLPAPALTQAPESFFLCIAFDEEDEMSDRIL